jgi:hypothetical protein
LLRQLLAQAACLALESAGSNIAAKMAMMAMTTNSSIKVKPFFLCILFLLARC